MGNVYVCAGSCGGKVTEEEFNQGKNTCGAESCEKHGEPLVKKEQCEDCAQAADSDGQAHVCPACT